MGRRTQKHLPVSTSVSRAAANKKAGQEAEAIRIAAERLAIFNAAKACAATSKRNAYPLIVEQIRAGHLDSGMRDGEIPSLATFLRWIPDGEDWKQVRRSIEDFLPGRSTGRPRKDVHPKLLEVICQPGECSIPKIHEQVQEVAETIGLPRTECPSMYLVRRIREERPPVEAIAGTYGAAAGRMYGLPKGRVAADRPHSVWIYDETRLPVWMQVYNRFTKKLQPVRPWLIAFIDAFCRVVVSYQIVLPYRQKREDGVVTDDVFGCFLSGALPELAAPACIEFAGYLPDVLRGDNNTAHNRLRSLKGELGPSSPKIPGYQPHSQGTIEAWNKTIKPMCSQIRGYEKEYEPIERLREDPRSTRTKAAASGDFELARVLIPTRELLNFAELSEKFAEQIDKYHHRPHEGLGNRAPAEVYCDYLQADQTTSGYQAVYMLEPTWLKVGKSGIRHRREEFTWRSSRGDLNVGEHVLVLPDPLLRGVYARVEGEVCFLPRLEDEAHVVDPAEVAISQRKIARFFSDQAHQHRLEKLILEIGEEAVREIPGQVSRRIEEASEEKRARVRKRKAAKRKVKESAPLNAQKSDGGNRGKSKKQDQSSDEVVIPITAAKSKRESYSPFDGPSVLKIMDKAVRGDD